MIPLQSILSIKIGSAKYENCISLICESRTLLLKIDDPRLFRLTVEGFMMLTEKNRKMAH